MTARIEEANRRYFPIIRAKCARMLGDGDEAQDVAQETFIRFWRSGLAEADNRAATSWIYRTSTNLVVDRLRRRRLTPPDGEETTMTGPDEEVHARRELLRLAQRLPPDELVVVLLARIDGLRQEEIASVLRVSDRTVRRMLRRVDERLADLREEMAP